MPGESLGGETNPRKEQRIQKLQHTFGFDWTRRWSKTLKSAGPERRARGTDGEGATGAARERKDPPRPEEPSKTECSVPRRRNRKERASENGGRTEGERSPSVATPATRPPRGGRGSGRAPFQKPTDGAIRQGAPTPRGAREWGAASSARPAREERERIDPQPKVSDRESRATEGSRHRRPPRGQSSGPSAEHRRKAVNDGDGAERAAHGLRSVRNEAEPGSESSRGKR